MASLFSLFICALLAIAVPPASAQRRASGCGTTSSPSIQDGKSANISIESGGLHRSYLLHIPKSYHSSTPVALILSFHGRTRDAKQQEELSQLSNPSFNPNWIAVYPQGVLNKNGIRQWQGDPDSPASVDDIKFAMDIIDEVNSRYCIDSRRVFVTGKSNGGGLVNLLACDSKASALIAAFAPVSGAYYLNSNRQPAPCKPARSPIPMLEFHGWLDETIPYQGGRNTRANGRTQPILDWLKDWVTRDGCIPAKNSSTTMCGDKKPAIRYAWSCNGMDEAVVHFNVSNLKHDWPSINGNVDSSRTTCFDATSVIMEYFTRHSLPVSPWERKFPVGQTQAAVGRFELDETFQAM